MKDSRKTKAQLIAELDGLRQHATQQNREMTIQSALEQVRARALAMQTSADLFSVTAVLHEQMAAVGIEAIATAIEVVDLEGESLQSAAMVGGDLSSPWQTIDLASFRTIPVHVRLLAAYQRGEITYTAQLEGEELSAYWTFWRERLFAVNPEARDREFANRPRVSMTHVFFPRGWIYLELGRVIGEPGEGEYQVVDDDPPTAADLETIKRFADVFDFAYSRFLELKQKEEQNRELTVQNALERVRARALGMRSSDDIGEVTTQLFREFRDLGIPMRRSGIWILDVEPGKGEIWLTEPSGALLKGEPFDTSVMAERRDMARTFEAFKEGERFLYFDYTVAEIVDAVFFFRDRLHMSLEYMGEDAKVIANRLCRVDGASCPAPPPSDPSERISRTRLLR